LPELSKQISATYGDDYKEYYLTVYLREIYSKM
jgi:hypothetical protein